MHTLSKIITSIHTIYKRSGTHSRSRPYISICPLCDNTIPKPYFPRSRPSHTPTHPPQPSPRRRSSDPHTAMVSYSLSVVTCAAQPTKSGHVTSGGGGSHPPGATAACIDIQWQEERDYSHRTRVRLLKNTEHITWAAGMYILQWGYRCALRNLSRQNDLLHGRGG